MTEKALKTRTIRLNGETRTTQARTVAELVRELGLETRMIAVEKNLEVVPRSAWSNTTIADGDRIEIVQMIGGG